MGWFKRKCAPTEHCYMTTQHSPQKVRKCEKCGHTEVEITKPGGTPAKWVKQK